MQRLITWVAVLTLTVAMVLNVVLFMQNRQIRQQLTEARTAAQAATAAPQSSELDSLKEQLKRSETDRIKASREATSSQEQLNRLKLETSNYEQLKQQVQTLTQQNQQLQNEVTNLQSMNTINGQMVQLRGLTPKRNVERQFMDHNQLRDYYTEAVNREFTADAEQRQRAVLQALDIPGSTGDLRQQEVDSAVKSILGFYDHTTKHLVVITDRPTMGVSDRVTYAHEFVHSLQDQYYDLSGLFARAQGNNDYQEAIRALVEGDATLSMQLYAESHLSAMERASYQLEQVQAMDFSGVLSPSSGPYTESAASFPYNEGASFAALLYASGGWSALAEAFANPPRSTEQVLHPQAYTVGDEPQAVALPDLGVALGGSWKALAEDTLGELYMRIYLEGALPLETAIPASAGWGGDRYQVLQNDQGQVAFALRTVWDRESDAQEFVDAYSQYVAARSGGAGQLLESDAGHMRWQLADRQFYLSWSGAQVLVLHAPDAAALDAMLAGLAS